MSCGRYIEVITRKFPLLFVVDTSRSMEQYQDEIVNAINKYINLFTDNNKEIGAMVSVLKFSSQCEWVMVNECNPVGIATEDLLPYDSWSDVSLALQELSNRLSRSDLLGYMDAPGKPMIVFLSDADFSMPFCDGLIETNKNQWFVRSLKVGIVFGGNINKSAMSQLTGCEETVFDEKSIISLERVIKLTYYASDIVVDYQVDENVQCGDLIDTSGEWEDDWDDEWDAGMEGRDNFSSLRDGFSIQQSLYTQLKKAKKAMEIEADEVNSPSNAHLHFTDEDVWE